MFERFTDDARQAVIGAQEQARSLQQEAVRAEHLLLAVLVGQGSTSARVLREHGVDRDRLVGELAALDVGDEAALGELGIDLTAVRQRAEAAFGPGALDRPRPRRVGLLRRVTRTDAHLPFTGDAKQALEQSLRQALSLRSKVITVDHVLLGLLADDHTPAARTLQRLGTSPGTVRDQVRAHLTHAA